MRGQAFLTFPSIEIAHHALVCISSYFVIKPIMLAISNNYSKSFAFAFPACCKYSMSYVM